MPPEARCSFERPCFEDPPTSLEDAPTETMRPLTEVPWGTDIFDRDVGWRALSAYQLYVVHQRTSDSGLPNRTIP